MVYIGPFVVCCDVVFEFLVWGGFFICFFILFLFFSFCLNCCFFCCFLVFFISGFFLRVCC